MRAGRARIGGVSLLLTLVWVAALFAAFVGGRIGQHPSAPVALAMGLSHIVASYDAGWFLKVVTF